MGLPLPPVCSALLEVDRATPKCRGSSGARHVIRWASRRCVWPSQGSNWPSWRLAPCSPAAYPYEITDARGPVPAAGTAWQRPVVRRRPALIIFANAIRTPRRRRVAALASPGAVHSSAFTGRRDVYAVPTPSSQIAQASASKTLASRLGSRPPARLGIELS